MVFLVTKEMNMKTLATLFVTLFAVSAIAQAPAAKKEEAKPATPAAAPAKKEDAKQPAKSDAKPADKKAEATKK